MVICAYCDGDIDGEPIQCPDCLSRFCCDECVREHAKFVHLLEPT